ncbi:ATP synthase mitochondrial F1 complex assembly factor 2 [alpha proteobacterium Q-1]|nr:ATP synthase mitochondrial F1 complex assembly factor 2 [alpha proteobacterium Q-1]
MAAIKRFYRQADKVAAGSGFCIALDGRPVKTPLKADLIAPTAAMADAIVAEWQSVGDRIDPAQMPITRFLNSSLDRVKGRRPSVIDEIAAFGATDLTCYRAEAPESLVAAQKDHWNPPLSWLESTHHISLAVTCGVSPVAQDEQALGALRALIAGLDDHRLMALHSATTLSGSVVLGLAYVCGRLDRDGFWAAAMVDEDHQMARWGEDAEALAKRQSLLREFDDLDCWLSLL